MILAPQLPPLLSSLPAGPEDPIALACSKAREGVQAGLVVWSITDARLSAAMIFAPESRLRFAVCGVAAVGVGLQNALGALGPANLAVHIDGTGQVLLNGAAAGHITGRSDVSDPDATPGWLVAGVELALALSPEGEPGHSPGQTALDQEGAGDLNPVSLLEAWARHSLLQLSDQGEMGGSARLQGEWNAIQAASPQGGEPQGGEPAADAGFSLVTNKDGSRQAVPLLTIIKEG